MLSFVFMLNVFGVFFVLLVCCGLMVCVCVRLRIGCVCFFFCVCLVLFVFFLCLVVFLCVFGHVWSWFVFVCRGCV